MSGFQMRAALRPLARIAPKALRIIAEADNALARPWICRRAQTRLFRETHPAHSSVGSLLPSPRLPPPLPHTALISFSNLFLLSRQMSFPQDNLNLDEI